MPISVVPTSSSHPDPHPASGEPELPPQPENRDPEPAANGAGSGSGPNSGSDSGPDSSPEPRSTSRWIDYDTHELLEMISELEDERRFARLREGVLWAVLFHILLISAITWIPRYVFKVPPVIDPFASLKERKDLQYLDVPPDLMRKYQSQPAVKTPAPRPQVDRKTLDALKQQDQNKPVPQSPPQPTPPQEQAKIDQPLLPQPIPPTPQPQPATEAPRPSSVPAHAFQLGSQNPADQLQSAERGAARRGGSYDAGQSPSGGGTAMHPGAGTGGVQVLSDTQGVDFSNWIIRWHHETQRTWDPLIPDEANPPISRAGIVVIRFKVQPNGQLVPGSVQIEGRSGDTAYDRAAWGALTGSTYPPLPREFHGPYLELRAYFLYNERQ
jgi:hypothetical protein